MEKLRRLLPLYSETHAKLRSSENRYRRIPEHRTLRRLRRMGTEMTDCKTCTSLRAHMTDRPEAVRNPRDSLKNDEIFKRDEKV